MPTIKNILIFVGVAAVFVLIYIFFIKKGPDTASLVSSPPVSVAPDSDATASDKNSLANENFLVLLLNVKNIKLDDAIFSDNAFNSLHETILTGLTPDGNEGRPNPFAPLGTDNIAPPVIPPTTPPANIPAPLTP